MQSVGVETNIAKIRQILKRKNRSLNELTNFENLFLNYLSQSLNQWALLSTRLFQQPNYWRFASYATCVAIHVDLT